MAMTGMMRIDDRKGNSMIFIGITGGVGAGKSAVLGYLKELDGVRVMLSDEIAHELMEPAIGILQKNIGFYGENPASRGKKLTFKKFAKILSN